MLFDKNYEILESIPLELVALAFIGVLCLASPSMILSFEALGSISGSVVLLGVGPVPFVGTVPF